MNKEIINARVLIIDDEQMVRDNIEEILIPKKFTQSKIIKEASSILFDEEDNEDAFFSHTNNSNIPKFTVDKAINGMDGLDKINASLAENNPYAVIFLDMRMPGWDGLETAINIREVDTKAEIIIVTAFSDRSINEIVNKAGQNVGYHCKPYASEEILQLATKAVNDYNKLRNLERLISVISNISLSETQLNSLLQNILDQLAMYLGSNVALLGKIQNSKEYQKLFSIGSVEKEINLDKISSIITSSKTTNEEVIQIDELVFVKLEEYSIFAVLSKDHQLKTEKIYLLKLFVQNAAKAIVNAELHEKLLQKEKLTAVGNALTMLIHDLRSPIKSIPMLTGILRSEGVNSESLDLIDMCGEQASEIFEDFLDFIKNAPLVMTPIDIGNLVNEVIEQLNTQNDIKNISIKLDIQQGLKLSGDKSKLKRVLMNLLNNAIEVLNDKKINGPEIEISVRQNEDDVSIIIKDNGPGIPDHIINNLFEPFITVNKTNGTGLGLAIVKQYIVAHKGTIHVENNNGAKFIMSLPILK